MCWIINSVKCFVYGFIKIIIFKKLFIIPNSSNYHLMKQYYIQHIHNIDLWMINNSKGTNYNITYVIRD